MIILAVGMMIQSFIGILQYFAGDVLGLGKIFGESERALRTQIVGFKSFSRVGGTIGDANSLAMYINFIVTLLLCFLFTKKELAWKLFVGSAFLLGILTELLTLSRGGWMGLFFGMIASFYGIFHSRLKSSLKSITIMVIVVSFLIATTLAIFPNVRYRLFEEDYGRAYSRVPMMQVASNIIKDRPLTGVGLNNYTTVMNKYDRTRYVISYRFPFPVHNAFLMIAAESGLLALSCFLLVLAGALRKSVVFFKGGNPFLSLLGIGTISGLITWMVHAQFKMGFAGISLSLWFSLAMIAAIHRMLKTSMTSSIDIR